MTSAKAGSLGVAATGIRGAERRKGSGSTRLKHTTPTSSSSVPATRPPAQSPCWTTTVQGGLWWEGCAPGPCSEAAWGCARGLAPRQALPGLGSLGERSVSPSVCATGLGQCPSGTWSDAPVPRRPCAPVILATGLTNWV